MHFRTICLPLAFAWLWLAPPGRLSAADPLDGTWEVVSSSDGNGGPKWLIFEGAKVTEARSETRHSTTACKIDATKTPIEIDFVAGTRSTLGIAEVNGDTLRLCFTTTAKARPTVFEVAPGTVLATLKRTDPVKLVPQAKPGVVVPPTLPKPTAAETEALLADLEKQAAADPASFAKALKANVGLSIKLLRADKARVTALARAAIRAEDVLPPAQILYRSTVGVTYNKVPSEERTKAYLEAIDVLAPFWNKLAGELEKTIDTEPNRASEIQVIGQLITELWYGSGKLQEARSAAEKLLRTKTQNVSWNTGNVQHSMHSILGEIALAAGDVASAKRELLLAVKDNPSSPQLSSFGPKHRLAGALVRKGETAAVLEYLDGVAKFWGRGVPPNPEKQEPTQANQLEDWRQQVRDGKVPDYWTWK